MTTIISGGQVGVDRAALAWALRNGVQHGGWCPAGRRAEDGRVPDQFVLQELPSRSYLARTRRNVVESDGTLIIAPADDLSGGTLATQQVAARVGKPCFIATPARDGESELHRWISEHRIQTLNVAGPRRAEGVDLVALVDRALDSLLLA